MLLPSLTLLLGGVALGACCCGGFIAPGANLRQRGLAIALRLTALLAGLWLLAGPHPADLLLCSLGSCIALLEQGRLALASKPPRQQRLLAPQSIRSAH